MRFSEAQQLFMLLVVELKFENLRSIIIDAYYINVSILIDLCVKCELRHEILDHFEVHDAKAKI